MMSVAELITQLGGNFKSQTIGLGIAVSVPWPGDGPVSLYGANAVQAFNENVDAVELQDYSSGPTSEDAQVCVPVGVKFRCMHGLKDMFSWRLNNDHGLHGIMVKRTQTLLLLERR